MNALSDIIRDVREAVAARQAEISLDQIRAAAQAARHR